MATRDEQSPLVQRHGWGTIDIDGIGRLRDAKLWPGGGRAWDWKETRTRHRPGIQPGDVVELLDYVPEIVVLSRGRQLRLETSAETVALLDASHVDVFCEETGTAIRIYNDLAASGRRVAALFHTTC